MAKREGKSKGKAKPGKVVWRISAAAPLGEYVTPQPEPLPRSAETASSVAAKADVKPRELTERGWHHSSHELVHGLDLIEEPTDSSPGDLFDEFFKPQR